MEDCIFCRIIAGESPSSQFYADQLVLGIMSIGPVNTGHTMILPKQHVASLAELDEETGRHMWTIAQRTAAAIRASGIRCEGINIFLADGEAAFQSVFHVHLHVFPRFAGDPFKLAANWEVRPSRQELDGLAQQIQQAYDKQWGLSGSHGGQNNKEG